MRQLSERRKVRGPLVRMLILMAVMALVAAACGDDSGSTTTTATGETTTSQAPTELREVDMALSTTSSFGYGYWVAVGLGFYEDEGLDVNLQGTGGSSDVAQILAANNAVAGMGVPGAMLPAIEAGALLYPFFTYAYGEVFDVVVPEASDIASIAELDGLVIGISELAGGEVPLVRALLVEAGLDPDSDVQIIEVGTDAPSVAAAFDAGRIDAYSSAKSDIAQMNANGLGTKSIAPDSLSTLPAEGLLATEETKDDTDLLIGLGRGTAKGQLVAYTNPDAAVCVLKELIPEEFTDDEAGRAGLAAVIEITTAPKDDSGNYVFGFLDSAGWNTYVNIFIQGGVISEQIDMSDFVLDQYLDGINDFDQQEIVDLANGLNTDC
ncbi:MAG: ABC transporter substrate-binding protein [Acidimicrobiia bacterium]|nr:ABC transporter substrate-binding protein [Acidimicrobiia bacterium]